MNIQNMMKQAQEMQERLQQQMSELTVEATSGGGMVTVTVNGHKHLQKIVIDEPSIEETVRILKWSRKRISACCRT